MEVNVLDKSHFLDLDDLPADSTSFFSFGPSTPIMHWAFVGEIVEAYYDFRPRFHLIDRSGNSVPVHFHLNGLDTMLFDPKTFFKKGHTMCIYYAFRHNFLDMTVGIRVEELSHVKVIPCALDTLLSVNTTKVDGATECRVCSTEKGGLMKCSKCGTKYCAKDCQERDWKENKHKEKCAAIRQVREWRGRDWNDFRGFWDMGPSSI